MRDIEPELRRRGAQLIVIGNGSPAHARAFAAEAAIPFALYVDPERLAYRAAGTGKGIAPEHLPRLTERFYRVDRSRSRETGGTGLGLAIVKHVVQRHGAQLLITSKPGQGARFAITFPASRVQRVGAHASRRDAQAVTA